VLYRPVTAPPPGGDGVADAPTTQVIEDDGFARIGLGEPESLGDARVDQNNGQTVESSAVRGTGDEVVSDYRSDESTQYTIQVNGYNGATSPEPYILRVKFTADAAIPLCPSTGYTEIDRNIATTLPDGLETIIVFDQGRMEAVYGETETEDTLAKAQELVAFLNASPDYGDAAILFTDSLTDYSAWDANPCDWTAADAIAKSIRTVLADYETDNESLRYVTILGDDTVIPFHRQVDATSYANEDSYAAEFSNDALFGSLGTRHILTDQPYGDPDPIPWLDRFLYLPEVAVGRLLETPTEIATAIDTFITFDGQLDPGTALVSGYDFLTDGAIDTADALEANDITTDRLISDTWTDDDLESALFPDTGPGPTLASANAHFDYYRALPANENLADPSTYGPATLFQTDEVAAELAANATRLNANWLFTMGCHAGLSVPDFTVGIPTQDWAQTWAGNGGVLTANTGFGYGDTVTVALTEELVAGLARGLDGTLTVGQATVRSLQDYYGRAGLYGVYDEKAMQQFTTYGLPMYRVAGTGTTPVDPPQPTVTPDPFTGQPSATVVESAGITRTESSKGAVYSVDGQTLDIHYRPIQPMTSIDVTVDGLVARGALITGWTSTDVPEADIAYSRPVIDDSANEPELEDPNSVFPSTFAAIANFERPSTTPGSRTERRQNLNLIVGQYNAPLERQRLFDNVQTEVLYVEPDSTLAADNEPPIIEQVQASIVGNTVGFIVDVADSTPAARVVVLYRSNATNSIWRKADLVSGSPWSGGGPIEVNLTGPTQVEYLVQVAKASGLVSVSSSKGNFFQATTVPAPPDTTALSVALSGTKPGATWYTGPVSVTLSGDGGPFTVTVDGDPVVPDELGRFTITDDGNHTVVVTGADGIPQTFAVPIDKTAPDVGFSTSALIPYGAPAVVAYDCRDAGSGVTTLGCSGTLANGTPIDTTNPGTFTVTVTATDIAGNQSTTTFSYTVEVAPALGVAFSGTTGTNGWYVSDVLGTITGSFPPFTVTDNSDPVTVSGNTFALGSEGERTIVVTGSDGQSTTATVKIDKTAPTITNNTPELVAFGSSATVAFDCADAVSGIASCTSTIPVGTAIDTMTPGIVAFTVTATDNAGNETIETFTYEVLATPSITLAVSPEFVRVGGEVTATITIGGTSTPDLSIDWGDGTTEPVTGSTATHTYTGNGSYTVQATATYLGTVSIESNTETVTVYDPAVTVTVSPDLIRVGQSVTASATVDSSALDMLEIFWGDGTSTVVIPGQNVSHVYPVAGLFEVTATATFDDLTTNTSDPSSIVVYDPNAAYIAGNGKIDVPAGSFVLSPEFDDRVELSFDPKYKSKNDELKGKIKLKGKDKDKATDYEYQLEVETDQLDWMVVTGAVGIVQGTGTLEYKDKSDGQGGNEDRGKIAVRIRVTAIDADQNRNDSFTEDLVRVQIWDLATGETLFDTQVDAQTPFSVIDGKIKIKD
jgi:hypothetical protein